MSDSCVREHQSIKCEGKQSFDLKNVFNEISKSLAQKSKSFQLFVLNNSGIQSLESNTFADITFKFIRLFDVQSLKTIDEKAFDGTALQVEVFEMSGGNSLKDTSQLFSAIARLHNLITVTLNIANLVSLPPKAFSKMNRLQEVTISNMQLHHLSENFIAFELRSDLSLLLDLSNNNLTEFSFNCHSLSGVNRPLELDLKDNQISVLEPNIFREFLLTDMRNSIDLSANPINCSDCRMRWLVADKQMFESVVFGARCPQFVSIFELDVSDHFGHCGQ